MWIAPLNAVALATRALIAVLLASAAVYATYQVRACGGLDSYGYVSTSALIASGHLTESQPLVSLLPFDGAAGAAPPPRYLAAPGGDSGGAPLPLRVPVVVGAPPIARSAGPI